MFRPDKVLDHRMAVEIKVPTGLNLDPNDPYR